MNDRTLVQSHNQVAFFTYGLTALNLLVTALMVLYMSANPNLVNLVLTKVGFWSIMIGMVLISIAFQSVASTKPKLGLALWFVTSLIVGAMISPIILVSSVRTVTMAVFSTVGLCVLLTLASFQTHYDMTKLSNVIAWSLFGMIVVELLNVFLFHSSTAEVVISFVILAILSVMFMIDTQKVKKYSDSDLPFMIAVIIGYGLYLDIINIFLRLIEIFGRRN